MHLIKALFNLFQRIDSNKFHIFLIVDYFVLEYTRDIYKVYRFDYFFNLNSRVFTIDSYNNWS